MKVYGKRRYNSIILHLNTRQRLVISSTPQLLYPCEKNPWKLDWLQSWFGRCAVEENLFPLLGIEPRSFSPQHAAILSYPASSFG
jgi:hypothetical protein